MSFIEDKHAAITTLAITITAEISFFVMFFFARDKAREFVEHSIYKDDDSLGFGVAVLSVFCTGYFGAYAAYRLVSWKWPQYRSAILFSLATFAAGFGNLLLFYALLTLEFR